MYTRNRIQLLSDLEIDAIYSLPVFNETERPLYFILVISSGITQKGTTLYVNC